MKKSFGPAGDKSQKAIGDDSQRQMAILAKLLLSFSLIGVALTPVSLPGRSPCSD